MGLTRHPIVVATRTHDGPAKAAKLKVQTPSTIIVAEAHHVKPLAIPSRPTSNLGEQLSEYPRVRGGPWSTSGVTELSFGLKNPEIEDSMVAFAFSDA